LQITNPEELVPRGGMPHKTGEGTQSARSLGHIAENWAIVIIYRDTMAVDGV